VRDICARAGVIARDASNGETRACGASTSTRAHGAGERRRDVETRVAPTR
jgi:hypothetical protein